MATAYQNAKQLVLNRLIRTAWDGDDITVSPGGTNAVAVALAIAARDDAGAADNRRRIVLSDGTYTEYGLPPWDYPCNFVVGSYCHRTSKVYKCHTAHTSNSSFDATKFDEMLWDAGTAYTAGTYAYSGTNTYLCVVAQTGSEGYANIAAAVSAGKWVQKSTTFTALNLAAIDFSGTGYQYIDIVGSDKDNCILYTDAPYADLIKCGGAYNMVRDCYINHTGLPATLGYGYALHLDGNYAGVTKQKSLIYNCKIACANNALIGIGIYPDQSLFIIDCNGTSTHTKKGACYHHTRGAYETSELYAGKLAVMDCDFNGTLAGLQLGANGARGISEVVVSGTKLECTTAGYSDLLYQPNANPFLNGGTIVPHQTATTWNSLTGSGVTLLSLRAVYNSHPYWYRTTAYTGDAADPWGTFYCALYYSATLSAWVFYIAPGKSGGGGADAVYYPSWFEAGLAGAATAPAWANSTSYTQGTSVVASGGRKYVCIKTHTSVAGPDVFATDYTAGRWLEVDTYAKWTTENWNSSIAIPATPVGSDFAAANVPSMTTIRSNDSLLSLANELQVYVGDGVDGTNRTAGLGGNLFVNSGLQTSLTTKKSQGVMSLENVITDQNPALRVLSWVTDDDGAAVDPRSDVAAAADVRSGTPRWTGATGDDVGTLAGGGGLLNIE